MTVCLSGATGTGPGCQRAVSCPACVPVFPVLSGQAASRPDVQAFQGWFPSTAQTVSLSAVPCSCPPSFRLPAVSGGQSAVMVQFIECSAVLPDGMGVKNPPDFREPVLAFAPQDHVSDTVIIPHALQGPLAYAQFSGGFIRVEKPVRIFTFHRLPDFTDIAGYFCNLFHHCHVCGTFHRYHFHVLSFFLFLRQSSAINKRGFNNSLRGSREIFPRNGSVTRTNGATSCQFS